MKRKELLALEFYNKSPFTGSNNGIRFRIDKIEVNEETKLKLTVWPEPFAFDHTPEDQKTSQVFDFSEEGLLNITDYINSL